MAKKETVKKIAVVLPDGSEHDLDEALVRKYGLTAGETTPFSRASMAVVTRTVDAKKGPKDWTPEEDQYLFSQWDIVARNELARRLEVSPTILSKRYKKLTEQKKAEERARKRSSKKTGTKVKKKTPPSSRRPRSTGRKKSR